MREFTLHPPPRCSYTQWRDGSIHLSVAPQDAGKLADSLERLAGDLRQYVVDALESQRSNELQRATIPPSRIQVLEAELEAARLAAAAPVLSAVARVAAGYSPSAPNVTTPHVVDDFRNTAAQLEAKLRYGKVTEADAITPTKVTCGPDNDDIDIGPKPDRI